MADGSISDISDAVPGSWFWPSPALAVGEPWYSDMPDGSVVLRVLSQRGGQATTTPARIDDAAFDPDRTARLGERLRHRSRCGSVEGRWTREMLCIGARRGRSECGVWGWYATVYVCMGNAVKFYGDAATDEEVKSSSRKSA